MYLLGRGLFLGFLLGFGIALLLIRSLHCVSLGLSARVVRVLPPFGFPLTCSFVAGSRHGHVAILVGAVQRR
jgi:hypothetical protein